MNSITAAHRRVADALTEFVRSLHGKATVTIGEPLLEAVLVRGLSGRVGSTLLMQLLATSPEISFDRVYPFENRYLAGLVHYLEPLRGSSISTPQSWLDDPDHLWWVDPKGFGFKLIGTPLGYYKHMCADREILFRETMRGAWRAYSAAIMKPGQPPPRYYAEKYGGYGDVVVTVGIPIRFINLIRDPRDVWASVLAFDTKRGYYGFGRRKGQSQDAFLLSYVQAVRRRLDEMNLPLTKNASITVRYEDLVADLSGEAARIERWLQVDLRPEVVDSARSDFLHHVTTETAQESVERWRRDVTPADVELLERELGPYLDRLGYTR